LCFSCVYNFKIRTHAIAIKNIIIPVGDFLIMAISYKQEFKLIGSQIILVWKIPLAKLQKDIIRFVIFINDVKK